MTTDTLAADLTAARDGAILAELGDLGLIRASGADAAEFLHNLVTNDVKGIGPGDARVAGFCTPKGRLLAIFLIWRDGEDFLLLLPRDILPAMLKKLSMYVLRSKVRLTDASAEFVLLGVSPALTFGSDPADLPVPPVHGAAELPGGKAIRLDERRLLLALPPAGAEARRAALIARSPLARPAALEAWHWLEIAAGQPRVTAATQEAFVPQMLNMEHPAVAGVSFTKGCYPGQEIVARTHYLGKVKRRTYRAALAGAAAPGTHVYAPETGDQHCGAIVSIAPSPEGGYEALVSVQSSAVAAGEVHVGSLAGEPLRFLSLPYAVDG